MSTSDNKSDNKSEGKSIDLFAATPANSQTTKAFTPSDERKGPIDSVDPTMDNLIKEAIDRNKRMNEDKTPTTESKTVVVNKSALVMSILRNNGMDSQQAEKAHKQLMGLLELG